MIRTLLNIHFDTSYRSVLARVRLNQHRSLLQVFQSLLLTAAGTIISSIGEIALGIRFSLQQYWPISGLEQRQLHLAREMFRTPATTLYPPNESVQDLNNRHHSLLGLSAGNILNHLQFFDDAQWDMIWRTYRRLPAARWDLFQRLDFSNAVRSELLLFVFDHNPEQHLIDALFTAMLINENIDIAHVYANRRQLTRQHVLHVPNLVAEQEAIIDLIWPAAPALAQDSTLVPQQQPAQQPVVGILNDEELAERLAILPENEGAAFLERQRELRLPSIAVQERAIVEPRIPADDTLDELRAIYSQYTQNITAPDVLAHRLIAEPVMQQAITEIERGLMANIAQDLDQTVLENINLMSIVAGQTNNRCWDPQLQQLWMQIIFQREHIELPASSNVQANHRFIQDLEYLKSLISDNVHRRFVSQLDTTAQQALEQKRLVAAQALAHQQAAPVDAPPQDVMIRPSIEERRQGAVPLQFTGVNAEDLRKEKLAHEINTFFNKLNTDLTEAFTAELKKNSVIAKFRQGLQQQGGEVVIAETVSAYLRLILRDGTYIDIVSISHNTQQALQDNYPEAQAWGSAAFASAIGEFLSRSGERYEAFFEMLLDRVIRLRGVSTLMRPQRPLFSQLAAGVVTPNPPSPALAHR